MLPLSGFQRLYDLAVQRVCKVNVVLSSVTNGGQELGIGPLQGAEKIMTRLETSHDDQSDG